LRWPFSSPRNALVGGTLAAQDSHGVLFENLNSICISKGTIRSHKYNSFDTTAFFSEHRCRDKLIRNRRLNRHNFETLPVQIYPEAFHATSSPLDLFAYFIHNTKTEGLLPSLAVALRLAIPSTGTVSLNTPGAVLRSGFAWVWRWRGINEN
jgi:hypothetical protein